MAGKRRDSMSKRVYEIILQVPLGERPGRLSLETAGGRCAGTLEIMRFRNAVRGTLDGQGRCRLTGKLRTLLHERPFDAEGRLDEETAQLTLRCGRLSCRAQGKRAASDE